MSRILTRELLYTAATRAQRKLILAGTEEACAPRSRARWRERQGWAGACGATSPGEPASCPHGVPAHCDFEQGTGHHHDETEEIDDFWEASSDARQTW